MYATDTRRPMIDAPTSTGFLAPAAPRSRRPGVAIVVEDLGVTRRSRVLLRDVQLSVSPGELVSIIGASGAGKSTLLDAIAGVRPPTIGSVSFDGVDLSSNGHRELVGYVPQDDLIHRDLRVAETLRYAARLRLPTRTTRDEIDRIVTRTLAELDLSDRASVRVADLSGGQRKRVSIAVELLTRPRSLFLDEPTSGLDPATAANLIATLRRLAERGTTVVLTTHNPEDLPASDRIVVVARRTVISSGTPDEVRRQLDVEQLADIYLRIAADATGSVDDTDDRAGAAPAKARSAGRAHRGRSESATSRSAQWLALTARNLAILRRNRLTLAIMLAAPALVIAMFSMLFRPGALDLPTPDPTAAISTTYWMAFAAFFFGLTYGLLQICTEMPIVRREVFVGIRIGPYLAAKITVLAPVLALVNVAMLAVLRALDRLPALSAGAYGRIGVTLIITSLAALTLGLLASAAVADPAQATLALPMLCFPAVLFAGAVLPVATMNVGGRALSVVEIARWAFEAVGRDLGLASLLAEDPSGGGPALLAQHGSAFAHSSSVHWVWLALFAVAFIAATAAVLRRRTEG
jgi:ABC-type multidrug transport system ATPase subunit